MKKLGLLKENEGVRIVSLVPDNVRLLANFYSILVERGAGEEAGFEDEEYVKAGARVVANRSYLLNKSDIIITHSSDIDLTSEDEDKVVIGCYNVLDEYSAILQFSGTPTDFYSLALLPKTAKAMSMDFLSSLNAISGYQAVIKGFDNTRVVSPMMSGEWGNLYPAKVLVLGAGVAGLQAIATAKRLGALVNAFAFHKRTESEIEKFGKNIIEIKGDLMKMREQISVFLSDADLVITTITDDGNKAPKVITKEMISQMKEGSVIMDLSADTGGNTECTKNNETIKVHGTTIVGDSTLFNIPSRSASLLLSNDLTSFLKHYSLKEKTRFQDEILASTLITNRGRIVNERLCKELNRF